MNIDPILPGERVLCAVSGGADSMCLLAQMLSLAAQTGFTVLCAHFDHRQRGEESKRDADFVRAYCAEHAVACFVEAYEGGRRDEAALRQARYAFLRRTAAEQNCRWIATAHTADDQLETMLLNLARGSGLRGMTGITPVQGDLLRPMLDTTRADVEDYLREHQIPHVEDSSNASDDYARNRLRRTAVPAMQSVNAQAVRHAAETASLLREDADYLDSLAGEALSGEDAAGVSLETLRSLPRPIRARVFRLRFGAGLAKQHIDALHDFCFGDDPAALCRACAFCASRGDSSRLRRRRRCRSSRSCRGRLTTFRRTVFVSLYRKPTRCRKFTIRSPFTALKVQRFVVN